MSEERSKRLSQIFDPLARFTDLSGAGQSVSMPNSPKPVIRRNREPPPPPPPRPQHQQQHIDPLTFELAAVSGAAIRPDGYINWQERCLELQLELHRTRTQASRVRDVLREKLTELEQRVLEAEGRADEAEDKVRAMENRLCEWGGDSPAPERRAYSRLEGQIEEQKQLRLQDAKQVEAKAARIKEWVTNKLKELEQQNQLLREQNNRCNQQLELLRNHIATQGSRNNLLCTRGSVSLEGTSSSGAGSGEGTQLPHSAAEPHYSTPVRHRRNLSIGTTNMSSHHSSGSVPSVCPIQMSNASAQTQNSMHRTLDERTTASLIADELAVVVEKLEVKPTTTIVPKISDNDPSHDYAEIYTPSRECTPAWFDAEEPTAVCHAESDSNSRPPTPPLHRLPSWEAKIYQVAADGLQQSIGSEPSPPSMSKADEAYHHISVPVYATVKGRASQIRSMPFTGDSSDDSSEGEESTTVHNTPLHNPTYSNQIHVPNTINLSASAGGSSSDTSLSAGSPRTISSISQTKHGVGNHERTRDTSFESGISDDYAVPPDALSCPTSTELTPPTSAGNIFPCPVTDSPRRTDALEKSGQLSKLGGKLKTWRKRWFVLKNGTLTYWKSHSDVNRKPQGKIPLNEACKISRNDGAATFEIITGNKTYYLTADSSATMEDWIRVLQNVQRQNATKLLLSKEDNKPTIQGWLTKVKNGHSKRNWCVLIGKMFLYSKTPDDSNPLGQINMREARVEDVEHVSDSDSEEKTDDSAANLTVAIYPQNQGPSYLLFSNKADKDSWLYHLTVVSGGGITQGTQFEQLVQKLMEAEGDVNSVLWKHPSLVYTKETITSPMTTLSSEVLQAEAIKLFKCIQLFMSVCVDSAGIDYHVVLAQNALQQCLDAPELQTELLACLARQTSRGSGARGAVQQLLLCAITCDATANASAAAHGDDRVPRPAGSPTSIQTSVLNIDCKSSPPTYSFVQGWQLLALAVSLFVPKNNRLLWYLKLHLSRHSDGKSECGKYAVYCERALERTIKNGARENKPSRMEVLSILLKNPYHHCLPHAIPVHMLNNTYQVISFDGSTTVEEFVSTLSTEIGCRDALQSGFMLFSDHPIEKDLEQHIKSDKKLCDVISTWETALREKGSGKFENTRVIRLTYRNRLYFKHCVRGETDKERLLLCYQVNQQVVAGKFPVSRELAAELGALMAQLELGDYSPCSSHALPQRFYPYRYRAPLSTEQLRELEEKLKQKWIALKGRSTSDCVRIYLNCTRKWPFFGATLFQAKIKQPDMSLVWLAVSEEGVTILELATMAVIGKYPLASIGLFGGLQDDLVMLIESQDGSPAHNITVSLNKAKMAELTHLIADYKNALLRPNAPGTPQIHSLTRNGSHKASVRKPHSNPSTLPHTLNSHATTMTLGSDKNATLTFSSMSHDRVSHGQPDIVKSTPDHKKRNVLLQ